MATKQTVLTSEGLQKLKDELEELKSVKRREIADKIKVALSFGDLSENSEYDEAKNDQALVETRISEIENIIKTAKVVDDKYVNTNSIFVGCKVSVKDLDNKKNFEYKIVGSSEADPLQGKISSDSPIGSELLRKRKGDRVKVHTPGGIRNFEILKIFK